MQSTVNTVENLYQIAYDSVISAGFVDEINWQRNQAIENISEAEFLREGAWVILCSGFKEEYVRRIFDNLSLCFWDWYSADLIYQNSDVCRDVALKVFGNSRKINAIISMSQHVSLSGFDQIKSSLLHDPIEQLQNFPMIGKITSWHLAKNLGCHVAKPDRHLVRIAAHFNYESVQDLCSDLAEKFDDSIAVIDLVLWRYAALNISVFGERS